jgi:hypothetical protein
MDKIRTNFTDSENYGEEKGSSQKNEKDFVMTDTNARYGVEDEPRKTGTAIAKKWQDLANIFVSTSTLSKKAQLFVGILKEAEDGNLYRWANVCETFFEGRMSIPYAYNLLRQARSAAGEGGENYYIASVMAEMKINIFWVMFPHVRKPFLAFAKGLELSEVQSRLREKGAKIVPEPHKVVTKVARHTKEDIAAMFKAA